LNGGKHMSIRQWFGFNDYYVPSGEADICLDNLLSLYANALTEYFSAPTVQNINELIMSLSHSKLNPSDKLFMDWLVEKGMPELKVIASHSLPDDEQLSAKIDYEHFILEDEMDFEYREDVRASLINIVNELPEIIKASLETSATSSEPSEDWLSSILDEFRNLETIIDEKSIYLQEEIYYKVSNYRESVDKTDSLLFCFI